MCQLKFNTLLTPNVCRKCALLSAGAVEAQDSIGLRGGKLVVFTRDRSPYFQCRIKLPKQAYVYKSLGTMDQDDAVRLAEDVSGGDKPCH